jgi:hypothetical protein
MRLYPRLVHRPAADFTVLRGNHALLIKYLEHLKLPLGAILLFVKAKSKPDKRRDGVESFNPRIDFGSAGQAYKKEGPNGVDGKPTTMRML